MDEGKMGAERKSVYRQFAGDLDQMATRVAEMGDLLLAAHLQAALDHLRTVLVSDEAAG
ncbi:hypothetical protein [Novosphingobium cyanobacteriorum]|uniref:Phosphate transport system regulatory protein PhoU n=1 Tax=Novosphingobium cyanobacteriorum TaxID=3024215 RepID=A0ABT6CIP4_9SPHN|nr:hypothetical protein [Novosphingobium cyanobacteriorum]MDF8332222.1 hypothetical protein [Novosphingobium cyanobacteriorum]